MTTEIPTAAQIRALLSPLRHGPMQRLARMSGVPFTTLTKIRGGETKNPGIDTVRAFLPHVEAAAGEPVTQPAALS